MDYGSELLSWLSAADTGLLLMINGAHCGFLDMVMWWLSDRWIWIPLYFVMACLIYIRLGAAKAIVCIIIIASMVAAADQTSANVIRPAVGRLRPSWAGDAVEPSLHLVRGYCGGRFGFPSCHAANTMAFAVFLSLIFKSRRFAAVMVAWSLAISYSRIYLGVHYPGDVLAGLVVGSLYGCLFMH